tara:strand:+ start:207 stop:446 length:240 start_codon:yes stop_codon:yes gene_type:complete
VFLSVLLCSFELGIVYEDPAWTANRYDDAGVMMDTLEEANDANDHEEMLRRETMDAISIRCGMDGHRTIPRLAHTYEYE